LGKELKLAYSVKGRFTWGGIEIQLLVDGGKVSEAVVYSDAMEQALIARLSQYFIGCSFASVELVQALEPLRQSLETLSEKAVIYDIQGLLRQQEL
jgi:lipoate-protein ligase A